MILHFKDKIGAKRYIVLPAKRERFGQGFFRGTELAAFIKLPIVWKIRFDGNAEDLPPVEDNTAVKETKIYLERRAYDENQIKISGGFDNLGEGCKHTLKQGILMKEIFVGIGGKAKFGKNGKNGASAGSFSGHVRYAFGIEKGIGNLDIRHAQGNLDESVAVKIKKIPVSRGFHYGTSFST
jgi:hypothetical protein